MKRHYAICITITLMCFVSSCLTMQEPEPEISALSESIVEEGYGLVRKDTLTIRYLIQTDPTAILLDHIIIKNGKMSLDLTEEVALSIGISKDIYDEVSKAITESDEKY